MTPFDRLHPALQHHIVNSLGWSELRPLQEAAIGPVLSGVHTLLLAPTAGGKTEAAIFPVLSRMLDQGWPPLSVLYLCPIKALLNNLETRLRAYADLLGRRVAVWHGDVKDHQRRKIQVEPPDILLTTPESLEVVLVSRRVDHRSFFKELRVVVVDEIHAFAGDDRGWHLLALLERVSRLSKQTPQRIGLSATVGNPEALLQWLVAGSQADREVVNAAGTPDREADVQLDYVGSLENAALVISRLHRGEKRLVFCDSRSQVEELAAALRVLGVDTFVSHSSLSVDERHRAESAFAQGTNCVIAATSTLELGVDVGDLDRVIQIDAPYTVAAFLQRLGRTGRRIGAKPNCLFLSTTEDAFLRALGLLKLWEAGYVEPLWPPSKPYHVVAQQIMALALQEGGIGSATWPEWLGGFLETATVGQRDSTELVKFMVEAGFLADDGGLLWLGEKGETRFGRRNFLELFSIFNSPPMFTVLFGRKELGQVHQLTFQVHSDGPRTLSLGGRYWRVRHVDWERRQAYVEPSALRGRSRWAGTGQPVHMALGQAVAAVLEDSESPSHLSQRAQARLSEARAEHPWAEPGSMALVSKADKLTWWTYGGQLLNAALADALKQDGCEVTYDNFAVHFPRGFSLDQTKRAVTLLVERKDIPLETPLTPELRRSVKFAECLPEDLALAMLRERFDQAAKWRVLAQKGIQTITMVEG